jgi:hypothetical protein
MYMYMYLTYFTLPCLMYLMYLMYLVYPRPMARTFLCMYVPMYLCRPSREASSSEPGSLRPATYVLALFASFIILYAV